MFGNLRRLGFKVKQPAFNTIVPKKFSSTPDYHNLGLGNEGPANILSTLNQTPIIPEVPWFPRQLSDLNNMAITLMTTSEETNKEHAVFKDPAYKLRRDEIAQCSLDYKMDTPIPYLKYTELENKTWAHVYRILRPLQEKYMCDSFNKNFERLVSIGLVKPTEVPQLGDINEFLIKETNFRLKPVTGILSQREFLNALGLRTFCCTQYIRHHTSPEYTPEPDVVHELMGHLAMFIDPDFCDLSNEIGLFSFGISTENVAKLGALYLYTVEFGVTKEGNDMKGYGAGMASSVVELLHFGERKAQIRPLDPFNDLSLDYPIRDVQPVYYVSESFQEAADMLIKYGKSFSRPFDARFNHQTNSIDVDRKIKMVKAQEKAVEF